MSPASRRRALQAVSGLVAGLAGCSVLPSESDSVPVPTAWSSGVEYSTPGVMVDGGPLVVGIASKWSHSDSLVGFDPDSGDEEWTMPTWSQGETSALALDGGTVYLYTSKGIVRAVDPAAGDVEWWTDTELWDLRGPEVRLHAPVVVGDVLAVPASWPDGVGGHTDRVVGFDVESGDELWRHPLAAPLSGVIAASDGAVVLPRTDGVLEAVDASGERLWHVERPDPFESATATGGRAFVGTEAERVEVFDLASGEFLWAFETENAVLTPPRVVDAVVYAGSADYHLYAVDAESGERLWRTETSNAVTAGPVKVGDALVSVIGGWTRSPSIDRRYSADPEAVCVHDAASGDLRGEFRYEGYIDEGPPQWVRSVDGEAYVGHRDALVKLAGGALDG